MQVEHFMLFDMAITNLALRGYIFFKSNPVRSNRANIERYIRAFGNGPVDQVTPEHILTFLNRLTEGNKPYTKRVRYPNSRPFSISYVTISIPSLGTHAIGL